MSQKAAAVGLLMVTGLGVAIALNRKTPATRHVVSWRKNLDSTCTYTYDDGSEEVAVCSDPPA